MSLSRRLRSSAALLVLMGSAAGCSGDSGSSSGPRMEICGSFIGQAMMPAGLTWYVDATEHGSTISLPYFSPDPSAAGTWLRVSPDCDSGASVSISSAAVLGISGEVRTTDGMDAAVRISPVALGSASVTINRSDSSALVVVFAVVSDSGPPSA